MAAERVQVNLELNAKGDLIQIDNASAKIQTYEQKIESAKAAQSRLKQSAAFAGAAIGAAFIYSVKSAMDYGDQIAKASTKTGIAAEEISGLRWAAEQSGVGFDSLVTAMSRMARTAYDASQGTGEAAKAYAALGISVTDAAGNLRGGKDLFVEIAEKIKNTANPAERAALSMQVFGRAGADLLPLLMTGAGGIEELTAQAEKLGLVMSEEDAKAAEELNDALEALQAGFRGVSMAIGRAAFGTDEYAEKLGEAVGGVAKWIDNNRTLIKMLMYAGGGLTAFIGIMKGVATVHEGLKILKLALTPITAANTAAIEAETLALEANSAAQTANGIAAAGRGTATAAGGAAAAAGGAGGVPGMFSALTAAGWPLVGLIVASAAAYYFINKDLEAYRETRKEYKKAEEDMQERQRNAGREVDDLAWGLHDLTAVVGLLGKYFWDLMHPLDWTVKENPLTDLFDLWGYGLNRNMDNIEADAASIYTREEMDRMRQAQWGGGKPTNPRGWGDTGTGGATDYNPDTYMANINAAANAAEALGSGGGAPQAVVAAVAAAGGTAGASGVSATPGEMRVTVDITLHGSDGFTKALANSAEVRSSVQAAVGGRLRRKGL